jgi:hypothetical protein
MGLLLIVEKLSSPASTGAEAAAGDRARWPSASASTRRAAPCGSSSCARRRLPAADQYELMRSTVQPV